jgi:hypothetical protein
LFFGTARAARRVPKVQTEFFLILIQVGQRMSYPLCYHNPMMKMKEQLFKVTLARWEDGTATTTHVLAMDLDHAKRVAWKKWKSVEVEPAKPFPRFDGKKVGEFNR